MRNSASKLALSRRLAPEADLRRPCPSHDPLLEDNNGCIATIGRRRPSAGRRPEEPDFQSAGWCHQKFGTHPFTRWVRPLFGGAPGVALVPPIDEAVPPIEIGAWVRAWGRWGDRKGTPLRVMRHHRGLKPPGYKTAPPQGGLTSVAAPEAGFTRRCFIALRITVGRSAPWAPRSSSPCHRRLVKCAGFTIRRV